MPRFKVVIRNRIGLGLILLNVLVQSQFGHAKADSCLNRYKLDFLHSVPAEARLIVPGLREDLPREDMDLSVRGNNVDFHPVNQFVGVYSLRISDERKLVVRIVLDRNSNLRRSFALVEMGKPTLFAETIAKVDADCREVLIKRNVVDFSYSRDHVDIHPQSTTFQPNEKTFFGRAKRQSLEDAINAATVFAKPNFILEKVITSANETKQFRILEFATLNILTLTFEKEISGYSSVPWVQSAVRYDHGAKALLHDESGKSLGSLHLYSQKSSGHRISELKLLGHDSEFFQSVPEHYWLQKSFEHPLMLDFEARDFFKSAIRYKLGSGQPMLRYSNMLPYFSDVQYSPNGKEIVVTARIPNPPPSLPWNAPPRLEDQDYLKITKNLESEEMDRIAVQLRGELSVHTRLQAAVQILQKIKSLLKYENGNEKLISTDKVVPVKDFLPTGLARCQQFSALFTAIARRLGIPARSVNGFNLESSISLGHTWVEVKINEDAWWPLEPQMTSDRLPHLGYFPIIQHLGYDYDLPNRDYSFHDYKHQKDRYQPFRQLRYLIKLPTK